MKRVRDAKTFILTAALLAVTALVAEAHDLYLLPYSFWVRPGDSLQVEFHNGDAFPESENAPHPERLRDAALHGRGGVSSPVTNLQMAGNLTTGKVQVPAIQGDLQLAVHTIPNTIELQPEAFASYLKEEGLRTVVAYREAHGESAKPGRERYTKFAKSLLHSGAPDDFFKQPLGSKIEIVPLMDTATLHPGGRLPIEVLYQGKPAPGLQVDAAWVASDGRKNVQPVGQTDADGKLFVPLSRAGRWRLHTIRMERCSEPTVADWESSWASLTFELR